MNARPNKKIVKHRRFISVPPIFLVSDFVPGFCLSLPPLPKWVPNCLCYFAIVDIYDTALELIVYGFNNCQAINVFFPSAAFSTGFAPPT
jgi:hypothetical protein